MKKIILSLIFLAIVTAVYSQKSYRILSRGLVRDNSTNLIWTRCPLTTDDRPVYDFQCRGEKKLYSWTEAIDICGNLVHEGRSDWRLPNIKELQSIVFYHHYITGEENYSQVSEAVFPNTVEKGDIGYLCSEDTDNPENMKNRCVLHYWSSTPAGKGFDGIINMSWTLNFNNGVVQKDIAEKYKSVRCVAGP